MKNYKIVYSFAICFILLTNTVLNAQPFGDRLDLDEAFAPFYHGVASGDPTTERVIIWTRITTAEPQVDGIWRMATDSLFTENLMEGFFTTNADRDYTVKVDVNGLNPDTYYFYEFEALAKRSVRGRTKTVPIVTPDQYRIAFVSCSDMNIGYFNLYERIKERNDIEAVYHLGDYSYEYETNKYLGTSIYVRDVEPEYETVTLTDYRTRYSFYRLDPKLRDLHQNYPFVMVWDDHETANDSYKDGAQNHNPSWEGTWEIRKAAAAKAYLEWMPIREKDGSIFDISRSFKIGDLAEFYIVETRLTNRDKQDGLATLIPDTDIGDRFMIGNTQRNWLLNGMLNTSAQWKILVSPVLFTTLFTITNFRNGDYWDGYPWERKQIINFIHNQNIKNFVAISGDVHSAFAFDIPHKIQSITNLNDYDPETGEGSIGVNFGGTAISSGLCCRNIDGASWKAQNPHMKYLNSKQNGYCILNITPEKVTCDYFFADTIHIEADTSHFWGGTMCVKDSLSYLVECSGPSVSIHIPPALAPSTPRSGGDSIFVSTQEFLGDIVGVYPNPSTQNVGIQYFLKKSESVVFQLYDIAGKVIYSEALAMSDRGIHFYNISLEDYAKGEYILMVKNDRDMIIANRKLIKQ